MTASEASALHASPWSASTAGLLTRDLHLTVPLDRSGQGDTLPDGSRTITVYAREVALAEPGGGNDPLAKPPLLFLQGGPGFESPPPQRRRRARLARRAPGAPPRHPPGPAGHRALHPSQPA